MSLPMIPEFQWLLFTTLLTTCLWMPHILQRIIEMGPYDAFRDPKHDVATKAPWAKRAIQAHTNATENLLIFAILLILIAASNNQSESTYLTAQIFFFARLAHYIFYILGIPWARTPAFLVGFGCNFYLAFVCFGALSS